MFFSNTIGAQAQDVSRYIKTCLPREDSHSPMTTDSYQPVNPTYKSSQGPQIKSCLASSLFSAKGLPSLHVFTVKSFKHKENWKELSDEHSYSYRLDFTINIIL